MTHVAEVHLLARSSGESHANDIRNLLSGAQEHLRHAIVKRAWKQSTGGEVSHHIAAMKHAFLFVSDERLLRGAVCACSYDYYFLMFYRRYIVREVSFS